VTHSRRNHSEGSGGRPGRTSRARRSSRRNRASAGGACARRKRCRPRPASLVEVRRRSGGRLGRRGCSGRLCRGRRCARFGVRGLPYQEVDGEDQEQTASDDRHPRGCHRLTGCEFFRRRRIEVVVMSVVVAIRPVGVGFVSIVRVVGTHRWETLNHERPRKGTSATKLARKARRRPFETAKERNNRSFAATVAGSAQLRTHPSRRR
jgi:hypothetical protein